MPCERVVFCKEKEIMNSSVKKNIISLLPFAGYAAVVVAVFGLALFPPEGQLIYGDDIHRTYYFFKLFLQQFIREGVIPWWNPYLFSGQPMMAHPQAILLFHPINWLFVFLPVPLATSLYVAFHILLAMCGMYWLLRTLSATPSTILRSNSGQRSGQATIPAKRDLAPRDSNQQ